MFEQNLLKLLHLSDPTLPVGGFSHSAGLETYVQKGLVHDRESAYAFIAQQLRHNIGCTDAALLSLSFDAAQSNQWTQVWQYDQTCSALKLPREMREASQKLGTRLLKIFAPLTNATFLHQYLLQIRSGICGGHYCTAFAACAVALELEKRATLTGFLYNAAVGMVTNCVKLVPLGQQSGQELLFRLHDLIAEVATWCMAPDPEMVGMCCTGFDIHSMQHEQLYSRLYMS